MFNIKMLCNAIKKWAGPVKRGPGVPAFMVNANNVLKKPNNSFETRFPGYYIGGVKQQRSSHAL